LRVLSIHVSATSAAPLLPAWITQLMDDTAERPQIARAVTARPSDADDVRRLDRALSGDPAACRTLIDHLAPVVQARVARALLRRRAQSHGRDVRSDVEDMTQSILLGLFDHDGKTLRSWDGARGLSLKNFVGLVAERQVAGTLRSVRKSPWTEDPTLSAELDEIADESPTPETQAIDRSMATSVLDRLRARLSPLGLDLFRRLCVESQEIDEITRETGMARDALYQWRSRLNKALKQIVREIEEESHER